MDPVPEFPARSQRSPKLRATSSSPMPAWKGPSAVNATAPISEAMASPIVAPGAVWPRHSLGATPAHDGIDYELEPGIPSRPPDLGRRQLHERKSVRLSRSVGTEPPERHRSEPR